ncbi:MAG TPA: signal peptidase I [Symbiobacteriaceae bacterium]
MSQGPERPPEAGTTGVTPRATRRRHPLVEWAETLAVALLVALLIRGFVVQVYLVEGESMEPTLHSNERLLVNKLVYRFRDPLPGEIVVLRNPVQGRDLIKRVVAVAGETVEVRDGVVYINGKPLEEPYKNTLYTDYPDTPPVVVPEGTIYVMGDNRGRSYDSRMMGPVDIDLVEGKAFFMFWPPSRFSDGPLYYPRTYAAADDTE